VSEDPRDRASCEAISANLLEFALGTISGNHRSVLIEHLESCSDCRAELASLTAVTDSLLWLAPQAEPPLGFESRVVERFSDSAAPMARRHHRALWLVAAALIFVVSFGIGTTIHEGTSKTPSATSKPLTARLMSDGEVLGQVFVSPGRPPWLYMSVDDDSLTGVAWCEVTLKDGRVVDVGSFSLKHGYGAWTSRLNVAANQIRGAELIGASGAVIASATLRT
jgi:anti-sigma factor RsiW